MAARGRNALICLSTRAPCLSCVFVFLFLRVPFRFCCCFCLFAVDVSHFVYSQAAHEGGRPRFVAVFMVSRAAKVFFCLSPLLSLFSRLSFLFFVAGVARYLTPASGWASSDCCHSSRGRRTSGTSRSCPGPSDTPNSELVSVILKLCSRVNDGSLNLLRAFVKERLFDNFASQMRNSIQRKRVTTRSTSTQSHAVFTL